MKKTIEEFIAEKAYSAQPAIYRTPLTGYARADDEIFQRLKSHIADNYLLPGDLLPGAKSVLAFFLPFNEETVAGNRGGEFATYQWAETYELTNKLINEICSGLSQILAEKGVKTAFLLPTYEFDKVKLLAQWSHKHTAYACGLGTFGRNQMLITPKGCGGRFGTMVLDLELEPSTRPDKVHDCSAENGCDYCIKNCPVQAVSKSGYDRHRCFSHCRANDDLFPGLGCVEVCGKCATGPCGYKK